MASGFDRDKYKGTFEKRFGAGSYDAGLSKAREIGATRARADFEKEAHNQRVKAFEKQMNLQKKAREKDASDKKKAKEKKENNVINQLVEAKKKEGKKEPKKSALDTLIANKKNEPKKKDDGNFLSDMWNVAKRSVKAANPFDDISFGDAMLKNAMEFDKEKSKQFDEVSRSAGRLTNSASLGIMGNIDKKTRNGETPSYLTKRKVGEGGGADMLSDGLGYLIPGVGIAKALKGTKAGAKGVGDLLSKPLTKSSAKTIGKETAKEGAAVGAIMSGVEIAGREVLNPDDSNWKQNLAQFGLETGAGAILDPALTLGASKLISKLGKSSIGRESKPELLGLPAPKERVKPKTFDELVPKLDETAATSTRPKYDIDTLMRSFNGQDVSAKPKKFDSDVLAKQVDEIDSPKVEADFTKDIDVMQLKDRGGFKTAATDMYRNFDRIFGEDSSITKRVVGEIDASKARNIDMQERLLRGLKENVVDKLGIKKGSKLSRYVQDYGEKNMDLPTLMAKAPKDWEKVVEADEWFQATYKATLKEINAGRALAYPGDESKLVKERKDYYRHYQELTGLSGLKNIFDSPSAISPHLAGTSEFTKPGSKYASFMQKRGLGPYKSDAVGGFLDYIPSAAYATHIDPNIPNIRKLKDELADITEETGSKHLNGTIEYLHHLANDFAGKTNPVADRFVQSYIPGGRTTMAVLNWTNNRVKTNTILANLGSTLAQIANVPNGVAFAKQHSVKGLARTMKGLVDKAEPIHKSPFLKERYADAMYRQFDQRWLEQPMKAAEWLIETADRSGTSFVWNSIYEKGLKQGNPDPIKYADSETRKLIGGRGVGEVPLGQKSKVMQMVVPFTLEVGNMWHVMNDMKKAKDFGGLALLFASNYVLNRVMEEVRGSPITFDPIDAMLDSFNEDLTKAETAGRLSGEVLSNIPGGQYVSGIYPEDGEIGGLKLPRREEMFGDRDPRRFGSGLVMNNGVTDPLFKILPKFGGNQMKKALEGAEVLKDGGSYKEGKGVLSGLPFMGEKKELNFPVERTKENIAKSLLFGGYSTGEAREYFDNDRNPLGPKQTEEYHKAVGVGVGQEFYDLIMNTRLEDSVKRKIKAISEDDSMSEEKRMKEIEKVLNRLETK